MSSKRKGDQVKITAVIQFHPGRGFTPTFCRTQSKARKLRALADFQKDFLKGGFKLDKQLAFLPYQYLLILTR